GSGGTAGLPPPGEVGEVTFSAPVDFPTGDTPRSIALGDLDRDHKLDLVVANSADSTVSVLRGVGDGTFEDKVDYALGSEVNCVAPGDLNDDGTLDLTVVSSSTTTVSVSLG